jgi:hypothetical protein
MSLLHTSNVSYLTEEWTKRGLKPWNIRAVTNDPLEIYSFETGELISTEEFEPLELVAPRTIQLQQSVTKHGRK